MHLLVSGSTGLIGSALLTALRRRGDEVTHLLRASTRHAGWGGLQWDFASALDADLKGVQGVVHLAGESIGDGKWTESRKVALRRSRVRGTRLLSQALAAMKKPPAVLVCASAVGIYGDRGDEVLRETSPVGAGFLAELCRDWEAAAEPAREKGIRVVHLRVGVVLSPKGGALEKMLPPFRLGLGGPMGSGEQYLPWVGIHDAVGAILHGIDDAQLEGAVNVVAPQAVTNRQFVRALGKVLGRPALLPMPAFVLRAIFGAEKANEALLASVRVEPTRLLESGYAFRHPELEPALRHLLGNDRGAS